MREKRVKVRNGALTVCIGLLSLEVYWPSFYFGMTNYKPSYGFMAKTMILYMPAKNWAWDYPLCAVLLGFGIGGAWNHVDNPAHIERREPKVLI